MATRIKRDKDGNPVLDYAGRIIRTRPNTKTLMMTAEVKWKKGDPIPTANAQRGKE